MNKFDELALKKILARSRYQNGLITLDEYRLILSELDAYDEKFDREEEERIKDTKSKLFRELTSV